MLKVHHLTAGAHGHAPFVRSDYDRVTLLRAIRRAFGARVIAYCILDTHIHFVLDGDEEALCSGFTAVLRRYTRGFNERHGLDGELLRGRVESTHAPNDFELSRMIRYVHQNPLNTHPPIVRDPMAFEWSSARELGGVSRAGFACPGRARELLGAHFTKLGARTFQLADLEPCLNPSARPELLLSAAAQTFGVLPEEMWLDLRSSAHRGARAAFVALGRLEGYRGPQLAAVLECTRQRVSQLARSEDVDAVRIARTLIRAPMFRERLRVAVPAGAGRP